MDNKRGVTLIASIMLIVFASIIVLSLSTFIVERLALNEAKIINLRNVYHAQAGINRAVYDFRSHDRTGVGYFSLGQTNIDTEGLFVLRGTSAGLLMVDNSQAALFGNNRILRNFNIQNATNTNALTISQVVVQWNNNRRLTNVTLCGVSRNVANLTSPATVTMNASVNRTPTIYNNNSLTFNGAMNNRTIMVDFIMSDGTTKRVTLYSPGRVNVNNFTVKAMGQVRNSNNYRTFQAEYNSLTGRIIDFTEINEKFPALIPIPEPLPIE